MWSFPASAPTSVIRWLSPALLLFLSTCAQPDSTKNPNSQSPDPAAEQVTTTPSQPSRSSPNADSPSADSPSANSPSVNFPSAKLAVQAADPLSQSETEAPVRQPGSTPTQPIKSAKRRAKPAPVTTNQKTVLPDDLAPTFRTSRRMAGFSTDGNYYLYLESSRDTGAGIPKSSLQMVEMASNSCVQRGCIETRYSEADASLDIADAENDLLQQTWKLRQELALTPTAAGTELAVLTRSQTADGMETVTVRLGDQPLRLRLRQQRIGDFQKGDRIRAAMQLEVIYNGQRRSLDSLNNFRDWVLGYSIREVRLSPDGKHVAVLLTVTKPTFEGTLGTTLVQGLEL